MPAPPLLARSLVLSLAVLAGLVLLGGQDADAQPPTKAQLLQAPTVVTRPATPLGTSGTTLIGSIQIARRLVWVRGHEGSIAGRSVVPRRCPKVLGCRTV